MSLAHTRILKRTRAEDHVYRRCLLRVVGSFTRRRDGVRRQVCEFLVNRHGKSRKRVVWDAQ